MSQKPQNYFTFHAWFFLCSYNMFIQLHFLFFILYIWVSWCMHKRYNVMICNIRVNHLNIKLFQSEALIAQSVQRWTDNLMIPTWLWFKPQLEQIFVRPHVHQAVFRLNKVKTSRKADNLLHLCLWRVSQYSVLITKCLFLSIRYITYHKC